MFYTLKEMRDRRCHQRFFQCHLRRRARAGQLYPLKGLTRGIPSRLMLEDEGKAGWVPAGGKKMGHVLFSLATAFVPNVRFSLMTSEPQIP